MAVVGDCALSEPGQGDDALEGHDAVEQDSGEGVRGPQPGGGQRGRHGDLDDADTAGGGAEAARALASAPCQENATKRDRHADGLDGKDQAARVSGPVEHPPGERRPEGGRAQPEKTEPVQGVVRELGRIASRVAQDPLGREQ